ncbi:protein serine/threonine phosphatase [Aureococcus anophagefferens]|nr:protein serine/threonine phosphatase [Aureococcus anophagefferens]
MVATTAGPPSPMTPTRKMELKAKEADGGTGPTPNRRLTVGFDAAQAPREGFDSVKGDAYTKKRSKRRSFQQAPEDRGSEVLLQAAEAAEAAKQAAGKERDRSYQAKEIYEPDWALSPFPSTVVGTFSCHGIEPSYFTAGATAKINQDRGLRQPDHPLEMPRILKAGGFVKKGVDGLSSRVYLNKELTMVGLAMARSLGDRCVKHVGVIAEPAVVEYAVDEAEDAFIIVASDGIWEFVPSQYAVDLASDELERSNDAAAACRAHLEGAARWSEEEGDYRDDITCMVLKVNPLTFLTKEGAAYLPAAADDKAGADGRRRGEDGTGVVDTVGVDTVGDGIADTFYPAKAVDSTGSGQVDAVEVDTNDPRKASNMYGGQSGARASQKAAFARAAAGDAAAPVEVEEEDGSSRFRRTPKASRWVQRKRPENWATRATL